MVRPFLETTHSRDSLGKCDRLIRTDIKIESLIQMGGVECKHNRFDVLSEEPTERFEGLFKFKCGVLEWKDCGGKGRGIKWTGKITGLGYGGWKVVDPKTCDHRSYHVKDQVVAKEQTLGGSFARLFMGPAMDGIQYHSFLKGTAECYKCMLTWPVRAEFKTVWKNKEKVRELTSDWKKIETQDS